MGLGGYELLFGDIPVQPEISDMTNLVNEIQLYNPAYDPGVINSSTWDEYYALVDVLGNTQHDYIAQNSSQCTANYNEDLLARAQAGVDLSNALNASLTGSQQTQVQQVIEQQYQDYRANGGDLNLSLEDWVALGMPQSRSGTTTAPVFENQLPSQLAQELQIAEDLGVTPMTVNDDGFDELVNSGTIIWAIDTNRQLFFAPNTVNHTVLTNGEAVISAGEVDIAPDGNGGYILLTINNQSVHYQPGEASLEVAREIFSQNGIR